MIIFRPSLPASLFLAFSLALSTPAPAEPIAVTSTPVQLSKSNPGLTRIGKLAYMGGVVLSASDTRFGGLSGLLVMPDGQRIVAVSDKAHWFSARLLEDADGHLKGLDQAEIFPILDEDGIPLEGKKGDAEAITNSGGGAFLVSFERYHRVWSYSLIGDLGRARATQVLGRDDLGRMPANGGLEAMTVLPDGRLVMFSEAARDQYTDFKGWLTQLGYAVAPLTLVPSGDFKPTDLGVLPSNDLILLERRYSPFSGIKARLSRIDLDDIAPGARLKTEEIALLAHPLTVDNFEGIAAREDSQGRMVIYLLSDDNFSPLQKTLLLKFQLMK